MNDLQIEDIIENIIDDMGERPFAREWETEAKNLRKILKKHLKSLHPTEDTTQEREVCPLKPGEYMKDNFGNIITYEDLQKGVKPIYDSKSPESNRKHIIEDIC